VREPEAVGVAEAKPILLSLSEPQRSVNAPPMEVDPPLQRPAWATKRGAPESSTVAASDCKRANLNDELETALGTKDSKVVLQVLLKGYLQNSQQITALVGDLWRCAGPLMLDSQFCRAVKKGNAAYSELVQSSKETAAETREQMENCGPPQIHTFLAAVEFLIETSWPLSDSDRAAFRLYHQLFLVKAPPDLVELHVKYFRLKDIKEHKDKEKKGPKARGGRGRGAQAATGRGAEVEVKDKSTKAILLYNLERNLLINVSQKLLITFEQNVAEPPSQRALGSAAPSASALDEEVDKATVLMRGLHMGYNETKAEDIVVDLRMALERSLRLGKVAIKPGQPPKGLLNRLAQRLLDTHWKGR
jgi:hypothetical protein